MNYFLIISFGVGGMLLLSMIFSLILAVKNYERMFNLYYSAVVLTVIIYNGANTFAVGAEVLTVNDYIFIEKLTNIVLVTCAMVYLRLISHMSGFHSKKFFAVLSVVALVLLIANQILPNGMVVDEIVKIEKISTPLGEKVNNVTITTSVFAYVSYLFIIGLSAYMVIASRFAFRNQRREEGLLIVASLIPPVLIIMIISIFIDQKYISPFTGYFINGAGFLFLIFVLGHRSAKEVLNSVDRRKELLENEEKYRLLFDSAGDAILLLHHGLIIDCNPVTLELFRCTREKIIGQTIFKFSPEFQPDGESSVDKAKKTIDELMHGGRRTFSWVHLRLDGTLFSAEIQLNPFNLKGKLIIQAVVRDVTIRLEAEKILRNSEGKYRELSVYLEDAVKARTFELAETNKQLESFSNSVSQDLHTPLRTIESFSRMLIETESDGVSEDGKHRLTVIRESTAKMNGMIDDLLSFARTSKVEIVKITVDVNILVTKILEELVPKETDRKFEITVDALPAITGDPGLLRQVFVSLIGNAVKFTRHCSTAKIRIGGSETAEQSTITIHDNGCGFDMKYSDKLFGIFQRLHSEQEYEGSGVGLAIVRRIIQRHDGTVSAFAEPGKGTRVTVTVLKPQPQR